MELISGTESAICNNMTEPEAEQLWTKVSTCLSNVKGPSFNINREERDALSTRNYRSSADEAKDGLLDPEVSVLLHCAAWHGLLQTQVQVELSERYSRQTDAALDCHIEGMWKERLSREPWLFNGAKFRLHSFSLASPEPPSLPFVCSPAINFLCLDCGGDKRSPQPHSSQQGEDNLCDNNSERPDRHEAAPRILQGGCGPDHHQENGNCSIQSGQHLSHREPKDGALTKASSTSGSSFEGTSSSDTSCWHSASPVLTLRLGLTCYKDFLGTNWSPRVGELRRRGEVEFGDPLALLAQPLGVGGVLCTSDGWMVLIRRSQQVAEAGGLLDIPGGHPEPKMVCKEQVCMASLQRRPQAVVAELFSSVCAEISDEVNVPLSSLGRPVLMGIAVNHTSAGRPSAEFHVSCSLTSDQVRELYWQGGLEAHESTDILFLSKMDLLQLDRAAPLWSELCPSAKGAVLLYQLMMPDG